MKSYCLKYKYTQPDYSMLQQDRTGASNGADAQADGHHIGYHPQIIFKIKEPLHNVEGVAVLPDDRLIAADKHDDHVWMFSSAGDKDKPVLFTRAVKPTGIATNANGLIAFLDIKDKKHATVKVFTSDGTVVSSFGQSLEWQPHGIALSDHDYVVVTDMATRSGEIVRVFSKEGELLSSFGDHGDGKEQLREPFYTIVDCKHRVLVSDKANNCIKGYSLKGEYLGKMGSHGSGPGHVISPRGLAEDSFGNILVCDAGNRRVTAFTHNGHFIKHVLQASEGVHQPIDMDCNRTSGRLVVAMHTAHGEFHKIKVYETAPKM